MATPSALVLACEECGEVPHRVLSGRVTGKDVVVFTGTVRCTSCGRVSSATVREARPVLIPVVVSEGERSERETIEFAPDELVSVGDRIEREGHLLRLTAIEVGERRVPSSRARDVRTMWAKRVDRVRVKVAVNKGNRTVSHEVGAAPDGGVGGDGASWTRPKRAAILLCGGGDAAAKHPSTLGPPPLRVLRDGPAFSRRARGATPPREGSADHLGDDLRRVWRCRWLAADGRSRQARERSPTIPGVRLPITAI